jgi:DNA-binding winged helix-turn-helix (wHTH) protein
MSRIAGNFRFGPFQLDVQEHRLVRDGVEVSLQLKTFEVLCALLSKAGSLLTKQELLRQVWPDSMVEENNLNKNICLLRKVLGRRGQGQPYIETVPRVGYRFVAEVAQPEIAAALTTAAQTAAEPQPEKSVAVLYFENLNGDREDEYFRDGMTEDVITELAKIKGLRVFPRSSVLAFRDTPVSVTEVGRQLRAAFVLEGSIRRFGSCLRITARLA